MSTDVATRKSPSEIAVVRQQFGGMAGEFKAALPAHIPVERFMRVVMTAIQNNPDLLDCNRRSLFNSAMKAAQDGLLPDGREGAIVPYKSDAQWLPMVGGIRKKARNSGEIATWDVHAVYENDEFDFELGDEPFIKHKPTLGDPGKLIAVYSIATLKSGEISRDVMSVGAVEKIRSKSRGKNTPWNDPIFYPEMAKKTVAKRHSKVLPMSSDLDDLMRRDDGLYDIDGASDKIEQAKRPGLAGRLDALADMSDGDTIDNEKSASNVGESPDGADQRANPTDQPELDARDQAPGDQSSGADKPGDLVAEARKEGAAARESGRSRKSVPSRFRNDPDALAVWLEAFDGGSDADGQE